MSQNMNFAKCNSLARPSLLFLCTWLWATLSYIIPMNALGQEGISTEALMSGTTDISSPDRDAVISILGCTGTLITSRIVLTSGHCFTREYTTRSPDEDVYPHLSIPGCTDWQDPNRWYNFRRSNGATRTVEVKFGIDKTNPSVRYRADQYSLPGCADIVMVRLTENVPRSIAIPASVATKPGILSSIRRATLEMVGFGSTGLDDLIKISLIDLNNWNRTDDDGTPPWRTYAHAHGTTGLAVVGNNIFSAGTNFLWIRPIAGGNIAWQKISTMPKIVSMTSVGETLFAATLDNNLIVRPASPNPVEWRRIGHANNVTGLASIGNRLFAATSGNTLWTREAVLDDADWQRIGHANDVADMTSLDGSLYAVTTFGHLWKRTPTLTNTDWQYVGDTYYKGLWDHDQNSSTAMVDIVDTPRNIAATSTDLFVSINTGGGANSAGFYPSNSWPIRQTGIARFGTYPFRDGKHFTVIGAEGVRGRPGDSGGPVFWIRPGQTRVLIGVNRQIHRDGANYVATFFNGSPTDTSVPDTLNVGVWIDRMASPSGP